jgi:hypothetical protein
MRDDGSDVVPGAADTSQRFRHDVIDIAHARGQVYARPVLTIDSFFVRMGDVLSAALVLAGTSVVVVTSRGFAAISAALAVVAPILAWRVGRYYKTLTVSSTAAGSAPA